MSRENQFWIEEMVSKMPVDIRAEVIIADLIDLGLDPDDAIVSPTGLGKRSFSNDVLGAKWIENKTDRELLYINVSRESIYDALPEGLFHQPKSKKSFRTTQEMIDMVKQAKVEEEDARKFFAPYEQEFFRHRIEIESQERKTLSQLKDNSKSDLFINFWHLSHDLNDRELSVMLNLLPLTYKIAGDFNFMSQCFENVLKTKIQIKETEPIIRKMPEDRMLRLGESSLGVNAVLGNRFNDGEPGVELMVGPLNNNNVLNFVPGGRSLKVIEILLEYFMPVEIDVTLKILVDENTFDFTLNDSQISCRLGFNTALKKSKLNTNIATNQTKVLTT